MSMVRRRGERPTPRRKCLDGQNEGGRSEVKENDTQNCFFFKNLVINVGGSRQQNKGDDYFFLSSPWSKTPAKARMTTMKMMRMTMTQIQRFRISRW